MASSSAQKATREYASLPVMSFSYRRRQRDSLEIDVFDASRYFSGCIDRVGFWNISAAISSHRPILMRNSLETEPSIPCQEVETTIESLTKNEEKKYKQAPLSPRRKLATFLNSLFQQTQSKKKKNLQKSDLMQAEAQSIDGEEHIGGKKMTECFFSGISFGEKKETKAGSRAEEEGEEINGDAESDSSSDLFELKIYDFSEINCQLPVYQRTNAGVIRRTSSLIARVAF